MLRQVQFIFVDMQTLARGKVCSDDKNTIMLETGSSNVILDCHMKTQNGWVARVEFLHERKTEGAHMPKEVKRKGINDLHTELGHSLEEITWAMGEVIDLQLTSMFEPCKACALGKAERLG